MSTETLIPSLFEFDLVTRQATGSVAAFCSDTCRDLAEPTARFAAYTVGVSPAAAFADTPQCLQCGKAAYRHWSHWYANPFKALLEATRHRQSSEAYEEMLDVLRRSAAWDCIDAETFLDDVLEEIGGATNYVCQYRQNPDGVGEYRAAFDD